MLLLTGSESSSAGVFSALVSATFDGQIPTAGLRASWTRILALKANG
jgi:hypothetical protein